jgi:hypothetical protein
MKIKCARCVIKIVKNAFKAQKLVLNVNQT